MNRSTLNVIVRICLFWALLYAGKFLFFILPPDLPQKLIIGIVGTFLALGLTICFLKIESKRLPDIGFVFSFGSFRRFWLGAILGIAIIGIILSVLIMFSPLKLEPVAAPNILNIFAYSAVVMFAMALMEEIIFRGYPLVKLQETIGVRGAIYVTSVIFGLYHGLTVESLIGPAVWGLLYGLMAVWSKGIALPTGLHFGLNWAQGFVGMKNEYVEPLWEFAVSESSTNLSSDTIGLIFQLLLFLTAVILIEYYIRTKHL